MAKGSIPAGLPDLALLRKLAKKTAAFRTVPSHTPAYLEWLKALRDRIAPELSYTNVTFPLFTPHDEQNHIHPLFILTERLLGSDVLQSLNATELFVLACSLYAHDWGMAVSEAEKKCIIGLSEPSATDSFNILENDRTAFTKLLQENRISKPRALNNVPLEIWQTYIRKTHAARTARRVKAFFAAIDENLGEAVALVSEGHSLDVEHLRSFETALPLQGESANICALALYLRLIDLFDLAQDRTPYALWKFISPEDPKSTKEWSKHRALSPVVIEQFQETSRCIKIRGATDDHRVYAALEDMREYCDSQLHLSNGLLNELEPRYQPRLLHLDWKVKPKGFEPITVRFEFDRQAMINVLSDAIYQGDRYVFLRELMQNSIDAIRLRRALHESRNTGVTFDGVIQVKVEHQPGECAIVSWTDNGCGMNEFIVRNYLTVTGRSFYRSEDFQKLGVKMDPISRFGIGILSCFMVTDSIEIVTRQDPQIEPSAEALRIEVHSPKRHLRIQRYSPEALPPVGTTVKVFVSNRAANSEAEMQPQRLNVTGYLKDIAGFVEFPIYVEEDDKRTVILHPDCVASWANTPGWEVTALDCSFVWQDYFMQQDARRARDFFTEEKITIKPNAKNPLFEGTISFPVLKEDIELRFNYGRLPDEESHLAIQGTKELGEIRVRGPKLWPSNQMRSEKPRSSNCENMFRIYCDGVLVAGISAPDWVGRHFRSPSTYRVVLNILRTTGTKLDLSRHDIATGGQIWSEFVLQQCVGFFRKRVKQIVAKESPKKALYRLARLVSCGCGFSKSLSKYIGDMVIPLIVLEKTGDVAVVRSTSLSADFVNVVPKFVAERLTKTIVTDWVLKKWIQGKATKFPWAGGPCVFAGGMDTAFSYMTESLREVEHLHKAWLEACYDLRGVRFLSPGKMQAPPLIQEIWVSKKFHNRTNKECDQSTKSVKMALRAETYLAKIRYDLGYNSPKFVEFAAPFAEFFTAGWHYLNVLHPVVQALAECIRAVAAKQLAGAISEHDLGTICDTLQPVCDMPLYPSEYFSDSKIEKKREAILRVFDLTSKLKLFELPADLPWAKEKMNIPPMVVARKLGAPIRSVKEVGS